MNCTKKYLTAMVLGVALLQPVAARLAQASNTAKTAAIYATCKQQVKAANLSCKAQARVAVSADQVRAANRACTQSTRQRIAVCKLRARSSGFAGIVTNAHFGAASW